MSTADVRNLTRAPGRLYWGGTDAVTSVGTGLGVTRTQRFIPNVRTRELTAEEWGGIPYEVIYAGEAPVFLAVLRSWDATAVSQIFPQGSSGSVTARARSGGANRAGALLGKTKGGVLYFKPDSASDPGVWFHRAVPMPDAAAELTLRAGEDIGFGMAFLATPNSSGDIYSVGLPAAIQV